MTRSVDQAAPHDLSSDATYGSTAKFCDIIMKGGITSGVVYPLAVCELAEKYQFKSIGGASAGAIAAAGAAAAELGRQRLNSNSAAPGAAAGPDPDIRSTETGQPRWRQGFAGLAQLPGWIGSDGNLLSLFQPQAKTRPLFRLLIASIGRDEGRIGRIVGASVREFPGPLLLGLLPGLVLLISAIGAGGIHLVVGLICALLLLLVGAVTAVGLAVLRLLAVEVPANRFGICSGLDGQRGAGGGRRAVPLTTWLTDYLDALAGKPPGGDPLTFGELWGGPEVAPADRNIDLQMMTTCLTLARPFRLPFDSQRFMFRRADFEALFPARVVQWMVDHPGVHERVVMQPGFHAMPAAANLPVVVAARISLSFPVLFSAVPLYAVDYTRPPRDGARVPEPCWFSDGGITSNLPVHFFDSALPRWPTFAINLQSFEPGTVPHTGDERQNVYFPRGNVGGQLEGWVRYDPPEEDDRKPGLLSRFWRTIVPSTALLTAFIKSIIDTMQNWVDSSQIRQPGFRDRTIHIKLDPKREGGLNLNMPPDVTRVLGLRGRVAGLMLRERFGEPPTDPGAPSWDNHRWIQYRTLMASLEQLLAGLVRGVSDPLAGDRPYEELIDRTNKEPPGSYRWKRAAQQAFARQTSRDLLALARAWRDGDANFGEGAPSPRGDLRQMPRL